MKKLSRKNKSLAVVLACSVLIVAGCDLLKGKSPAPASVAPATKTVTTVIQPVVQKQLSSVKLPPAPSNQLDFNSKKDPFKPYLTAKVDLPGDRKKSGSLSHLPIHSFDVSQFRLAGVIVDSRGNRAQVVDPDKKTYVLKVGMTIGKNEGRVTNITTTGVDVVEQFRDENNKLRKETIRIPLLRKP